MAANRVSGDLEVTGNIRAATMSVPAGAVANAQIAANADIARSKMAMESLVDFTIPLTSLRVWDALHTNLPNPSASDDLGLYGGTFSTHTPLVQTGDLKAAGATTRYARFEVVLPIEYVAGETVVMRFRAGMKTTQADNSATLDIEVYKSDEWGGLGTDLCFSAPQDINSTTESYKDFIIDSSGLAPGDKLDIRVAVSVNDAATATPVIATIGAIKLRCDIRG